MKTNKLDNSIKEKLKNRTFEPSASAWERLSVQLDEDPKQKKIGWFFYIGAAASILLLVSVGFYFFTNDSQEIIFKDDVVIENIDTNVIDKKIEILKTKSLIIDEAVVKKDEFVEQEKIKKNAVAKAEVLKESNINRKISSIKANQNEKAVTVKTDEVSVKTLKNDEFNEINILKRDPNSAIKINAEDLLFAVTHSPKEVKAYYAKYNVNREDVLRTIKGELKKSNFKIDPNTILAEVERTIDDDVFQNNFMNSLKRKVSDIASAIASRNDR